MENRNNGITFDGIGFFGLLGIVFIVLKLCKVITWSWFWVIAPLWMPTAIVVLILIIVFLVVNRKYKKKIKF